jgi:hypothetical protein
MVREVRMAMAKEFLGFQARARSLSLYLSLFFVSPKIYR